MAASPVYRALVAMAFLASGPCAWGAATTDAVLSEIQAALDTGDAAHAQSLAGAALAEGDVTALQRARLLLDRGLARELLGASQDAMADFGAALQTYALPVDERAQALLQRGFLLDAMDRLDDAAKDYGAVAALKTASAATALNNRANIYRRQKRLVEAKRDYLASLAAGNAKPQFPYYGLGQIAEAQGDTDAAREFYAQAVAADPAYGLGGDRLAALGGAPTTAAPGLIVLHPPPGQASGQALASPPKPAPTGAIVLHPPSAPPARPPAARPRSDSLGLRPALDTPAGSDAQVQLGSWRSEAQAQAGWARAQTRAHGLLDGLHPDIVAAALPGKGLFYRLRVGTSDPVGLCAALRARGVDCLRVRD